MRLTQIKLAGFKSFVDPMNIPVAGQLVGVVGPNGCGKSNIIDAVRWVLGESAASRLRGESLQDVIFNGSGGRKPTARAAVELLFDNREGRAPGQWQPFAEIAVRRVLERNGDSHFFINNIAVRKRDIADLFLGTGVGARAYGIIEQGMVSRIVEARPDELRTFLEEAAGVSRYRERRKETEGRLQDARINLDRVHDVLRGLTEQIERLGTQAEAARRYRDLCGELRQVQAQLLALRAFLAAEQARVAEQELAGVETAIEAQLAAVRSAEAQIETLRQSHADAADALQTAQAAVYAAGGEVTRIEQDIRHLQQSRGTLGGRIEQTLQRQSDEAERARQLLAARGAVEAELAQATRVSVAAVSARQQADAALAQAEATERDTQAVADAAAGERQAARAALQTAESEVRIVSQRQQTLQTAQQRLQAELATLGEVPADDGEAALAALRQSVDEQQRVSEWLRAATDARDAELLALRDRLAALAREQAAAEATAASLEQVRRQQGAALAPWLAAQGLDSAPSLLDGLRVEPGWEAALEAVLGHRLQARRVASLDAWAVVTDLPPTLALVELASVGDSAGRLAPAEVDAVDTTSPAGETPLATRLVDVPDEISAALHEALRGVGCTPSLAAALQARAALRPGELLVCPEGVLVGRHWLQVAGAGGELARANEWLAARDRAAALAAEREPLQDALASLQATQHAERQQWQALQGELQRNQAELRRGEVEAARQREAAAQAQARRSAIVAEQQRTDTELAALADELAAAQAEAAAMAGELAAVQASADDALAAQQDARAAAQGARLQHRQAERAEQEAGFRVQSLQARIADLDTARTQAAQTTERLAGELAALQVELATLDDAQLAATLADAVASRQQAEAALVTARECASAADSALREAEQQRMAAELAVSPLRERVAELRARIDAASQARGQQLSLLAEMGVATHAVEVPEELDEEPLKRRAARLQRDIEALGDVNLAAIGELAEATERRGFLDAQSTDLQSAIDTLEDAIRRIDRDSRQRLQHTFDEVNRGLSELFPAMFGGGEARLELTGEEILDAGLQLTAHPPGKRNSSIALLSGGEKALTALALVFALFRLNPAPFCLLDEVDAPLDDSNTERFCQLVRRMSAHTQFLFITHNKVSMEMAQQLVGVTMPEPGVSRVVAVDVAEAVRLAAA